MILKADDHSNSVMTQESSEVIKVDPPNEISNHLSKHIWLSPKYAIFFTIFLSLFGFGFIISVVTNFTFRAALLSLIVLPLFLKYRIKLERILIAYGLLVVLILLSALLNKSSFINMLLFIRVPVFSYLIYHLVTITLTPTFITKVIKAAVLIAMIQLPIIVLQWQLYDYLPLRLRGPAGLVDFGSGTFTYKTDYAMIFFLTLIIIFLLFEEKRNHFIKNRFVKALWLSGTVMIANSQIMKIALLIVWFVYVIKGLNIKKILIISLVVIIMGGVFGFMASKGLITEEITTFVDNLLNPGSVDTYLAGGYSRTAALKYLVTDGFSWLGAGPSAFSDPLTRTLYRGNTGHSFTFFSEIGILGWSASILIMLLIAFPINNGKIRASWSRVLVFASIFILSFTANVMNDVGVFLIFCILSKVDLVPSGQDLIEKKREKENSNQALVA